MAITELAWLGVGLGAAACAGGVAALFLARRGGVKPPERTSLTIITEQVRAVGLLVGLEVRVKEIATATRGWSWLPPLLLSPARVAMIFHFEKQYAVNLAAIGPGDVADLGEGRCRVRLPMIEGRVRLTDVTPYDIQDGRVLGLVDVIPVNAERQKELMTLAQEQAAGVFESGDNRYEAEARAAIERQMRTLLGLVGVSVELEWPTPHSANEVTTARSPGMARRLAVVATAAADTAVTSSQRPVVA